MEEGIESSFNKLCVQNTTYREDGSLSIQYSKLSEPLIYDEAIKRFHTSDDIEIQQELAFTLLLKGIDLDKWGRMEEAIAAYEKIVNLFGDATDEHIQEALLHK